MVKNNIFTVIFAPKVTTPQIASNSTTSGYLLLADNSYLLLSTSCINFLSLDYNPVSYVTAVAKP